MSFVSRLFYTIFLCLCRFLSISRWPMTSGKTKSMNSAKVSSSSILNKTTFKSLPHSDNRLVHWAAPQFQPIMGRCLSTRNTSAQLERRSSSSQKDIPLPLMSVVRCCLFPFMVHFSYLWLESLILDAAWLLHLHFSLYSYICLYSLCIPTFLFIFFVFLHSFVFQLVLRFSAGALPASSAALCSPSWTSRRVCSVQLPLLFLVQPYSCQPPASGGQAREEEGGKEVACHPSSHPQADLQLYTTELVHHAKTALLFTQVQACTTSKQL